MKFRLNIEIESKTGVIATRAQPYFVIIKIIGAMLMIFLRVYYYSACLEEDLALEEASEWADSATKKSLSITEAWEWEEQPSSKKMDVLQI